MVFSWRYFGAVILVTLTLSNYHAADARSSGLKIESACKEMMPSHGVVALTTPPKFSVTFTASSYSPGTPVSVNIKACSSTRFKGFMIQARRAIIGSDQDEALGSFTPVGGTQQTCAGKGLVHTNSEFKTSLTFDWNPPAGSQGHIQFRVTFVEKFDTIWVAVKSEVLKDASVALNPSTVLSPTTLAGECPNSGAGSGSTSILSGCGVDKGCIFKSCSDATCDMFISWEDKTDKVMYKIMAKVASSTSYIALGFSADQRMGDDSVTGCARAADGKFVLFNAQNNGKTPTMFQDNGVTLEDSQLSNNVLSCSFSRPKAAFGNRVDVSQKWIILFARGSATVSGQDVTLSYHQKENRVFTSEKYSSNDKPNVNLDPKSPVDPDPTTTPPVESGDLAVPADCGQTLGCVSKCEGSKCETIISWEEKGDSVSYTIASVVSSTTSFAAIGFSSDDKMGGDSVLGCASASDGTVVMFSAENTGQEPPKMFTDNQLTLERSKIEDRVLTCTIKRPKAASADSKRFDVSKKWIILFAKGDASVNGQDVSVKYHGPNKFFTSSKYSSSDTPNVGAEDLEYPLVKAHGSLMVAAWIFFASIGIVAARYYKPVWTEDLCSQKVWFQIHRTCMILVFCTTVAGFVVIFLEVEDWSDLIEDDEYLEYHPIMGVIVTALTVLNPLMALIRPHPGTKNRPIFNWAHWAVGTAAHVLGVITIFFGVQLQKAQVPDYMVYILAGFVAWQVLVEFILEVMQCCGKEKARQELYEMDDMNNQKVESKETKRTVKAKRVILMLHVFVLTVVSGVIIGFINIGEDELD